MTYTKIQIIAPKAKIAAGAKLGLDTKWATAHAASVERISPGHFVVKTPVSFPKGAVLWAESPEKLLPKVKDGRGDEVSQFDIIDMPFGYQEENPADVAKRDAVLKPKAPAAKEPKKAA